MKLDLLRTASPGFDGGKLGAQSACTQSILRIMLCRALLGTLLCVYVAHAQNADPSQTFQEAQKSQQAGDNAAAVEKYKELLAVHPEVVAAHANLGVALSALGRFDEAITEYHIALSEAPGSVE